MSSLEKIIYTEGHLIDSNLMRQIFDIIISDGGAFEIIDFQIGRNNDEYSKAKIKVSASTDLEINTILLKLSSLGCLIDKEKEIVLEKKEKEKPNGILFKKSREQQEEKKGNQYLTESKKAKPDKQALRCALQDIIKNRQGD